MIIFSLYSDIRATDAAQILNRVIKFKVKLEVKNGK